MFIASSIGSFLHAGYLSIFQNDNHLIDEKTIKISKTFKWKTPEHSWIYQRFWIPEKLHFIIRKTANIRYNREEVNRKLNKILLQELTIDASLETEIELVDENEQDDLIDTDS